jgi:hypothetical protein
MSQIEYLYIVKDHDYLLKLSKSNRYQEKVA